MARFMHIARVSLWVTTAFILGLSATPVPAARLSGESWIVVSEPLPLSSGLQFTGRPLPPQIPPDALKTRMDVLADSVSSTGTVSGQVTVQVTVRDPSVPVRDVIRVAGVDRYETALQASRDFEDGASTAVIATGLNWPDALGGTALAGAVRGPLLLTRTNELSTAVRDELVRLGVTKVYILGGTGAVGTPVEQALTGMCLTVVRLGGIDRYATSRLVADETIRVLGGAYSGDALVATGTNFPDATGGSALAAALCRPILLVSPAGDVYVPSATRRVTILGGTGAVSAQVQTALQWRLGTSNVFRAGGIDRYETAALVAQVGIEAGMTWDGVGVATGADFPDALSGGAMLGARGSVLLLSRSDGLSPEVAAQLLENAGDINTVHIFGGTGAIFTSTEDDIRRVTGIF